MKRPEIWAEALKISADSLERWSLEAPEGMPVVVHCLEQALIRGEDYFAWAQEHFGMAMLNSSFFASALDTSRLREARQNGDWKPWMFPVSEWDGVLYVACAEPPSTEIPDTVFLLADPVVMRQAWNDCEESSFEAPTGLSDAPPPFKLNLDNTAFGATAVDLAPENTVSENTMPVIPLPVEQTESHILSPTAAVLPEMPVMEKDPARPSLITKSPPPKPKIVALDNEINGLFTHLRQRYQASLVMRVHQNVATIYRWDPELNLQASAPNASVNLSYPTFLRIVSKTMMPYHGYLVDSPAHQELFAHFGMDKLPACVSAVPIRTNGDLWGIAIAFGDESAQKLDSLNFLQDAVDRLVHQIGPALAAA
ncbi:MAG TPA: hypothetical protein PKC28_06515 [Bdellovibrionales bacterium]|nr:hypothetical protein [Bdellovibrionales bacterium]